MEQSNLQFKKKKELYVLGDSQELEAYLSACNVFIYLIWAFKNLSQLARGKLNLFALNSFSLAFPR